LRLPNLFVPCGLRLRPGLRRDALRGLLASDPLRVTWLEAADGGGFTVQTLPATAFRPFAPYVSYTRERDTQPLTPDLPPTPFVMPAYTVRELRPTGRRPQTPRENPPPARATPATPALMSEPAHATGWLQRLAHWFRRHGHADAAPTPRADSPSTTRIPRPHE